MKAAAREGRRFFTLPQLEKRQNLPILRWKNGKNR